MRINNIAVEKTVTLVVSWLEVMVDQLNTALMTAILDMAATSNVILQQHTAMSLYLLLRLPPLQLRHDMREARCPDGESSPLLWWLGRELSALCAQ